MYSIFVFRKKNTNLFQDQLYFSEKKIFQTKRKIHLVWFHSSPKGNIFPWNEVKGSEFCNFSFFLKKKNTQNQHYKTME